MSDDKVIDFIEKRNESIEQKRRNFERVMFENFLGAFTEIDDAGTKYPVELIDISKDGCQFQVPWSVNSDSTFTKGTEIPMRMYFTKKSFIHVTIVVRHSSEFVSENGTTYMRYGCSFDKSTHSWEAMESFIDFMYKFAEHSTIEKTSNTVYYI